MRKNKIIKENAITLVALVITVIILIILAGVSLNLALGQNGIFVKSKEAVDKYKDSAQKEQNTLENIYVDMGGKPKFNPENLSIGEPINEETYGYKVTDYDVSVNGTTEWRLFYQDKNYTYIITTNKPSIEVEIDSILTNEKYSDGSKVGTLGKKLNSSLLKSEKCFTNQNTSNAIKITAWLFDETVWKNYCDDNACFAIGSPTLDLFVASWNATAIETEKIEPQNQIYDFGYNYHDTQLGEHQSRGHQIYDTYYWLSSPGNTHYAYPEPINEREAILCLVYDVWDHILSSCDAYSTYNDSGIRPIVAIPTDVFTQNYHLANE